MEHTTHSALSSLANSLLRDRYQCDMFQRHQIPGVTSSLNIIRGGEYDITSVHLAPFNIGGVRQENEEHPERGRHVQRP